MNKALRFIFGIAVFAAVMGVTSCSGVENGGDGAGYVEISIPGLAGQSKTRTVLPVSFSFDSFKLVFTKEGATRTFTPTDLDAAAVLEPGTWDLALTAYIGGTDEAHRAAAGGVTGIVVSAGETSPVTVYITFVTPPAGEGTLSYTITCPGGVTPAAARIVLTRPDESDATITGIEPVEIDISSGGYTGTVTPIAAAYYLAVVTLEASIDGDVDKRAVFGDLIHIYPGQTTTFTHAFTAEDFHEEIIIEEIEETEGDDIDGQLVEGYEGLPIDVIVPTKTGRRPIPLSPAGGKGYDGLLFHTGSGEVFDKDNAWRKAAWARIENFRKGNIRVLVKDASDNPVSGAAVNIAMYEHEFQWGTAVNNKIHAAGADRAKYRAAASALFNGAVLENQHKWVLFETNPAETENQFNAAVSLGLKHQRGHALVWDRRFDSGWETNNYFPQDLYGLLEARDRTALDNRIKNHILAITGAYKDKVEDWDVVNEILWNHTIRDVYGNGVLKQWFDWAREGAGPDTRLFINETDIVGLTTTAANSAIRAGQLRAVLDYMRDNDVDFDGIGFQSHFMNHSVSPEDFYRLLDSFKDYGKTLKVTEFDMGLDISSADRNYEAGFTRDILIAAFSQENIDGFLMWGFFSGSHWLDNAPVFNADWSLKESGKQYIDLVYNKWRTRETGGTGADGACTVRGYYGDYDITVSANGKTKTVEARCYRDGDNTIIVVLE
jgi:GH35 family endo-1,4-beta-xylanase